MPILEQQPGQEESQDHYDLSDLNSRYPDEQQTAREDFGHDLEDALESNNDESPPVNEEEEGFSEGGQRVRQQEQPKTKQEQSGKQPQSSQQPDSTKANTFGDNTQNRQYQDLQNKAPKDSTNTFFDRFRNPSKNSASAEKASSDIPTSAGDAINAGQNALKEGTRKKALQATTSFLEKYAAGAGPIGTAASVALRLITDKEFRKNVQYVGWGIFIVGIAIVFGISAAFRKISGDTAKNVAASQGDTHDGTLYQELRTTYDETKDGKTVHLVLSGTVGKYSDEDAMLPTGHTVSASGKKSDNPVALWDYVQSLPGFNQKWLDYYVTARWPYKAIKFTGSPGSATDHGFAVSADAADYAGKRIIIYDTRTKIGVVGIAMEYGPQAWTGAHEGSEEFYQQEKLWNSGSASHEGWRIQDPEGYKERIGGGGPVMTAALKATNQDKIYLGFAPPEMQNLEPGTIINKLTPIVGSSNSISDGGGYKVCIDPGHDANIPGATGNGLDETKINWDLANDLRDLLNAAGYSTVTTRSSYTDTINNKERAHLCNSEANIAIHIHVDSGGGEGYTVYQPDHLVNDGLMTNGNMDISQKYASVFHDAYAKSLSDSGLKDLGIKGDSSTQHGGLDVSNQSTIPTILVETFYIDNTSDVNFYTNKDGRSKIAKALAAGIAAYKDAQKTH